MKMKLSTLIHCRTFEFDFNSEFLARPSDFTLDDIKWAREHILPATSYCDELIGERLVLFNNKTYCVFGVVGLLDEILKKFEFSKENIEKFSFDVNKRKIKCFIGFVFHITDKKRGYIPQIQDKDYINLLKKYVANKDVFFARSQPGSQVDYCIECTDIVFSTDEIINEYGIYAKDADREKFKKLLGNVTAGTVINYCSNICNLKMLKEGNYNYFTADLNTIQRYKISKEIENDHQTVNERAELENLKSKRKIKKKKTS